MAANEFYNGQHPMQQPSMQQSPMQQYSGGQPPMQPYGAPTQGQYDGPPGSGYYDTQGQQHPMAHNQYVGQQGMQPASAQDRGGGAGGAAGAAAGGAAGE
nr:hypothetical protein L204_03396 [Cryptococcus depauperatus CBS 7855]